MMCNDVRLLTAFATGMSVYVALMGVTAFFDLRLLLDAIPWGFAVGSAVGWRKAEDIHEWMERKGGRE